MDSSKENPPTLSQQRSQPQPNPPNLGYLNLRRLLEANSPPNVQLAQRGPPPLTPASRYQLLQPCPRVSSVNPNPAVPRFQQHRPLPRGGMGMGQPRLQLQHYGNNVYAQPGSSSVPYGGHNDLSSASYGHPVAAPLPAPGSILRDTLRQNRVRVAHPYHFQRSAQGQGQQRQVFHMAPVQAHQHHPQRAHHHHHQYPCPCPLGGSCAVNQRSCGHHATSVSGTYDNRLLVSSTSAQAQDYGANLTVGTGPTVLVSRPPQVPVNGMRWTAGRGGANEGTGRIPNPNIELADVNNNDDSGNSENGPEPEQDWMMLEEQQQMIALLGMASGGGGGQDSEAQQSTHQGSSNSSDSSEVADIRQEEEEGEEEESPPDSVAHEELKEKLQIHFQHRFRQDPTGKVNGQDIKVSVKTNVLRDVEGGLTENLREIVQTGISHYLELSGHALLSQQNSSSSTCETDGGSSGGASSLSGSHSQAEESSCLRKGAERWIKDVSVEENGLNVTLSAKFMLPPFRPKGSSTASPTRQDEARSNGVEGGSGAGASLRPSEKTGESGGDSMKAKTPRVGPWLAQLTSTTRPLPPLTVLVETDGNSGGHEKVAEEKDMDCGGSLRSAGSESTLRAEDNLEIEEGQIVELTQSPPPSMNGGSERIIATPSFADVLELGGDQGRNARGSIRLESENEVSEDGLLDALDDALEEVFRK